MPSPSKAVSLPSPAPEPHVPEVTPEQGHGALIELAWVSLKLGLTSFGGPIAHLGYFREEYVRKRQWLSEEAFADLIALCQFLPGPASSQVGIGIGTMRAGLAGGIVAWLGFTLPSAMLMTAFAFGVTRFDIAETGWVQGLKIVAVAVVAQAVLGMARQFCIDRIRATIAVLAAIAVLLAPTAFAQIGVIVAAGIVGYIALQGVIGKEFRPHGSVSLDRRIGIAALVAFVALLGGLPLLQTSAGSGALALFSTMYRTGSLVFGGGHVVLPLLDARVVGPGWVTSDQFLAGYGAAQAVPGPLFTFAAYLGAIREPSPSGVTGATIATVGIFLPSFFMIWAALPFWSTLRSRHQFRAALAGINAGVVGILAAALYTPVWTSAILRPADFALALACFGLLLAWKVPPWVVVITGTIGGELIARLM